MVPGAENDHFKSPGRIGLRFKNHGNWIRLSLLGIQRGFVEVFTRRSSLDLFNCLDRVSHNCITLFHSFFKLVLEKLDYPQLAQRELLMFSFGSKLEKWIAKLTILSVFTPANKSSYHETGTFCWMKARIIWFLRSMKALIIWCISKEFCLQCFGKSELLVAITRQTYDGFWSLHTKLYNLKNKD